jgi:hypothetical protein
VHECAVKSKEAKAKGCRRCSSTVKDNGHNREKEGLSLGSKIETVSTHRNNTPLTVSVSQSSIFHVRDKAV